MADFKLPSYAVQAGESLEPVFFETGNIGLDMALSNGKGLCVGSYVILTAGAGAGKTTTVMDLTKRLLKSWKQQKLDWKIVYVDNELSKGFAHNVGFEEYINDGNLIYVGGKTTMTLFEQITTDILEKKLGNVKVLVVDSISNIISTKVDEGAVERGNFGDDTRSRNTWYKKFLADLSTAGVTVISIAQNRKKQNVMNAYEDTNKPAISEGDLHYADTILRVVKTSGGNNAEVKKKEIHISTSDKKEKVTDTFMVSYREYLEKNRNGHFPPVETLMKYGAGCMNWYILHKMLITFKYLTNAGSASSPKWNISKELQTVIEVEAPDNMKKAELKTYLNANTSKIKDFLRSRNEYYLVKENGEDGSPDNDDDDND